MLVHWIWFSTRAGLGDHAKRELLSKFQTPEALYEAGENAIRSLKLKSRAEESLLDRNLSESEKILAQCRELEIHILTFQDAAYPERLRHIPDPPMVLYYKGQLPDFDALPVIGVVGTRSASPYGLSMAKRMGYEIASCGGAVVSGLASGVDAMAMKGALSAGGCVVGVLGCGVDVIYPASNRALFADTQRYGCILSEFVPGSAPVGKHFPQRNRIISGLSCGVLVVEAPEHSGALITANLAADQGRDVFTVPANVDNPAGKGTNQLLKTGAIPVETGWDVLEEYAGQFPDKIHRASENIRLRAYPDEILQAQEYARKRVLRAAQKPKKPVSKPASDHKETKKVIDKREDAPYIDLNEKESGLSDDERVILALIKDGRRLVDDVIAESGLSAGMVMASLTLLEVKGLVCRLPGKMIALKGSK